MTDPTCPNGQHYYRAQTFAQGGGFRCVDCKHLRTPEEALASLKASSAALEREPECPLCHDYGNPITRYPCECEKDRWR